MGFDRARLAGIAVDVFGTAVDWRGAIVREGKDLDRTVDWGGVADNWLKGYRSRVEEVRLGTRPWDNLDTLLGEAFSEIVAFFDLERLGATKLARFGQVWHRLAPWPDTIPGLKRLRRVFRIAPLSNANMLLLTDMARHGGLPWDSLISAELVKRYKPQPDAYRIAAEYLGPAPEQVIYVASHKWDLAAGQAIGLRTAYIPRPHEMGAPLPKEDLAPDPAFDINATDFLDLARKLRTA